VQLGPVLNLLTGDVLNEALRDPNNRISKIVAAHKDDKEVVDELFLAMLCRKPTAKEMEAGLEALRGAGDDFVQQAAERKRREVDLAAYETRVPALAVAWEQGISRTPVWEALQPETMKSDGGATLVKQADNSILLSGPNNTPETYTVTFQTKLKAITGIQLEVLADGTLPAKGPGRAPNGNFVLNELSVDVAKPGEKPQRIKLIRPQSDFAQDQFPIANVIDGNPDSGWAISPQFGKNHVAVFEAQTPFGFPEGTTITVTMLQKFPGKLHNIGKFRISATTTRPPVLLQGQAPPHISKILDTPADKRTPEQKTAVLNHYRSIDAELARLQRRVSEFPVPPDARTLGAQDLAWALINSPAFLFNH
jgi:hypothetical protein